MNNNENINWREIVSGFSSYEGTLGNFCNENHITKSQFYYYKKKFKDENNNLQFHAISMREERVRTEITVVPADIPNIIIEIGTAKIYVPANEIARGSFHSPPAPRRPRKLPSTSIKHYAE